MTTTHHINFSTHRRGASWNGGAGGHFRESSVSCSCGWDSSSNGQTYAESLQDAKEHLRGEGVWFTESEKDVYVYASGRYTDATRMVRATVDTPYIMEKTGRSRGIVERALRRLIAERYVFEGEYGYDHTDKQFCWGI